MHLVDKITEHGLGNFKIGNDPVLHGPDGSNIARCLAKHLLGLLADGKHPAAAGILADGDNRRLPQDDTLSLDVQNRIRGSKIDGQVIGHPAKEKIKRRKHPIHPKKVQKIVQLSSTETDNRCIQSQMYYIIRFTKNWQCIVTVYTKKALEKNK